MAHDYSWTEWPHVEVAYKQRYSSTVKEFVPVGRYRTVPVMDTSYIGMCFRYYFENAEDLKNFEQIVKELPCVV